MITLKLKPWVVIGNIEHVGTSWRVGTDEGMTNILDELTNDTNHLIYYLSPVVVPVGTKYWITAKRHFKNSEDGTTSESDWLLPKPVVNTDNESALFTYKKINIEKPMIYVNKKDLIDDTLDTFTIKTSSFRGIGDGHFATHWIIRDAFETVLYDSLYDTNNLESIIINKSDISITDKNVITISAIHLTPSGIESPVGEVKISLFKTNFEIISNMDRVFPFTDYVVKFKKINDELEIGISKVVLMHMLETERRWEIDITTEVDSITIPGDLLEPNSKYLLDVYSAGYTEDVAIKRKELSTLGEIVSEHMDISFEYSKELTYSLDSADPLLPRGISTMEIYNSIVPVCNENEIFLNKAIFNRKINKLVPTVNRFNGVSLLNNNNENIFIKFTVNNKIVIDTVNDDGKAVFLIYDYNPYKETSMLEHTMVRDDETISLGKSNAIVFLSTTLFNYVPVGTNTIKQVNISTEEITTLATIPTLVSGGTLLTNIGRNRLFTYTGVGKIGYSFNLDDSTFIESMSIPTKFRGRELKSSQLVNGDSIIYRIDNNEADIDNNILYYDYANGVLEELNINTGGKISLSSVIEISTGKLLLIDAEGAQNKYFEFK